MEVPRVPDPFFVGTKWYIVVYIRGGICETIVRAERSAYKTWVYFLELVRGNLLESGVGVLNQHDEVVLVPSTRLWRRFEGIAVAAEAVVSGGRGVGSTVGLSSGFDPNDGVDQARTGVGRGSSTESSAVDVAPVTPSTADILTTRATLVNNKGSIPTSGPQGWRKSFDVVDLIVVRVGGSDGIRRGSTEGVVIGNVCFEILSIPPNHGIQRR